VPSRKSIEKKKALSRTHALNKPKTPKRHTPTYVADAVVHHLLHVARQVAVAQHHPLGGAGGARGVDQGCQVRRLDGHQRRLGMLRREAVGAHGFKRVQVAARQVAANHVPHPCSVSPLLHAVVNVFGPHDENLGPRIGHAVLPIGFLLLFVPIGVIKAREEPTKGKSKLRTRQKYSLKYTC